MNRNIWQRFIFLTLVLTVSGGLLTAGNAFDAYNEIAKILVTVEYNTEMTYMGQSDDIQGRVAGVSVGHDGLIIFDGATLNNSSNFMTDYGAPRVEKPQYVTITDYRGKDFEAEYIGVDEFSSIAYCRLPDSVRGEFKTADFKDAVLHLGDEIYIFWMLPENFEPRFQMSSTHITAVLQKPEKYYLTGELSPDFVLSPALNSKGELIGLINTLPSTAASYSAYDQAMNFGLPVGIMSPQDIEDLVDSPPIPGQVKRGWIGIGLQALDPEIAKFWGIDVSGGIIIDEVMAHTPAEAAGLKAGDFIVAYNDKPIEVANDASLPVFQRVIAELGAGAKINFKVIRPDGEAIDTFNAPLTLAEVPLSAADAPSYKAEDFDLTVRELVFSDVNNLDIDRDKVKGVIVDQAERGGWASVDGIQTGDIIMKVDDNEIDSIEKFEKSIKKIIAARQKEVVFMVWRDHQTLFVNVKTHWE